MTQVNGCLKWLLTVFNVHFAIAGGSIIAYTLKAHVNVAHEASFVSHNPSCFYILGSIIMVIGILGAVGAYNEQSVHGAVPGVYDSWKYCDALLGILGGPRPFQGGGGHEAEYRSYLPLDKTSMENKRKVEDLQTKYQCCGLFGYEDWEGHVPDSCLCNASDEMEGKCHTVNNAGVRQEKKSVFIQACFPNTISIGLLFSDIAMVITFGLAALGLLGMILSSIMIHQLRYPNRPVFLMSVPGFVKPPKYQELDNVLLPAKYY